MEVVITAQDFREYLKVRDSGITNMYDLSRVVKLSGSRLTRAKCVYIMGHFGELLEKYGNETK